MNSQLTQDFLECFAKLPDEIKQQARKCYRLWQDNPAHPGLHFKKIHGHQNIYSVRVGLGWRAVGLVDADAISWFWLGSHAEYDKIVG